MLEDSGPAWAADGALDLDRLIPDREGVTTFIRHRVVLPGSGNWRMLGPAVPGKVPFQRVHTLRPICRAVIAMGVGLQDSSVVQWIHKGVLLEPTSVDLLIPGCRILASAAELKVDLSQFQLVQDTRYVQALMEFDNHLRQMWPALMSNLNKLTSPRTGYSLLGLVGGLMGLTTLHPAVSIIGYRAGASLQHWMTGGLMARRLRGQLQKKAAEIDNRVRRRAPP